MMKFSKETGGWEWEDRKFCSVAAAIGVGAVAGLAGSAIQANAAESAASKQAAAANSAAEGQRVEFQQIRNDLSPFMNFGSTAGTNLLTPLLTSGQLTAPFNPTLQQLQGTPGYQFTLDQGLQAAQNGFASQGLGTSGAAIKGGVNYAEGLAGTTFQQQLQNYLAQNLQTYNMLLGTANLGENAAAGAGALGVQSQGNISNLLTGGANASAAGTIGSANALAGGFNGVASTGMNALLLSRLFPSGGSGTAIPSAMPNSTTDFGAVPSNQLLTNAGFGP